MDDLTSRPIKPALKRGWRQKCPNCGKGALFGRYLKVRDHCEACGLELYHHRADDGPAYMTITIVGHLTLPALGWAFIKYRPDPLVLIAVFCTLAVVLSLLLLPRIKGMIIGFQWAKRMHGFGAEADTPKQG